MDLIHKSVIIKMLQHTEYKLGQHSFKMVCALVPKPVLNLNVPLF